MLVFVVSRVAFITGRAQRDVALLLIMIVPAFNVRCWGQSNNSSIFRSVPQLDEPFSVGRSCCPTVLPTPTSAKSIGIPQQPPNEAIIVTQLLPTTFDDCSSYMYRVSSLIDLAWFKGVFVTARHAK